MSKLSRWAQPLVVAAMALVSAAAAHAQTFTALVGAGANPYASAMNPVTNTLYVANSGSDTVSVISGLTHAVTATVTVGSTPLAIAVNPVTNMIYTADHGGTVTIINGATRATTTLPFTNYTPQTIAVNSVTNKIYVGSEGVSLQGTSSQVTVIDGATGTLSATITLVNDPVGIAVNPVTNQIYVANGAELPPYTNGNVTVIDGATNNATSINLGPADTVLDAIAVNPSTNQIFASGFIVTVGSVESFDYLWAIDGATDAITFTADTGNGPHLMALNPVTNQVYVTNQNSAIVGVNQPLPNELWDVSVVDGNTGNVATVTVGSADNSSNVTGIEPYAVGVDPATNQIYFGNFGGGNSVAVMDGATNAIRYITTQGTGSAVTVTVNPVTNQVFFANYGGNVTVVDGTATTATSLPTGNFSIAMALNPVTNKLYVVNFQNNNGTPGTVTVLDGTTHAVITTLNPDVSYGANAVDVNPVTNMIYVTNSGSSISPGYVTVIDGSTDTVVTSISVGVYPVAVVVNPDTNKIFVTNYGYSGGGQNYPGSVSVIDGATNTVVSTVPQRPYAIAVNPATNRVYFSNYHSVTVADGNTGATLALIPTTSAGNIAVNPVTNKIYVLNNQDQYPSSFDPNEGLDSCTVIDGATNTILATPGTQLDPAAIAINPVTNMVYVVDQGNGENGYVTVINGATNAAVGFVPTPIFPATIAVNSVTNKIYVGNFGAGGLGEGGAASGNTVTVIDGSNTGNTANITVGNGPGPIAVNPVTDEVYVMSQGSSLTSGGVLSVIGNNAPVPLTVAVTPLPGNQTASATPTFTFTAQNNLGPDAASPGHVYFQIDSLTGTWTSAAAGAGTFSGTAAILSPGLHTLYAYATDGQDATATQPSSLLTGAVAVYDFVVTSPATQFQLYAPNEAIAGTPFTLNVVALDGFFNPAIGYTGTVMITSSDSGATLPAASTLAGVGGMFPVTLFGPPGVFITNGVTLTATDTATPSMTATLAPPGIGVTKVVITATLTVPSSPAYNGLQQSATLTTSVPGVISNLTYADLSTGALATTIAPSEPGVYIVEASSNDPVYYYSPKEQTFEILPATPPVTWATPAAVANGTALSATQLNATSTVPGTFAYSPAAGSIVNYPSQTLNVTFTPTDAVHYSTAGASVTLVVNPPPATIPVITAPPTSTVVAPGNFASFSVTATGFPAPTYQWSFNSVPIAGATSATYLIPVAEAGTAGLYSVTATNSQGSVTSSVALSLLNGLVFGGNLSQPGQLATDGVNLLAAGLNANPSDPNSNPVSHQSIFRLPLPLSSGPANSLYPASGPQELAVMAGSVFWIDPTSGPLGTQILSASDAGGGTVNPIYTSSSTSQSLTTGTGLVTDGTLLYAADAANGGVWSMNPDGSGLAQIGASRYAPTLSTGRLATIAVKAGTLYLADSGGATGTPAILSLSTSGSAFTTLASGAPLVSPSAIAVGGGMIYVADPGAGNTVWEIPITGGTPVAVVSGSVETTTLGKLAGLLYHHGNLFVSDSSGGAIYQLQVAPQAAPAITSPLTATGLLQSNFSYQTLVTGGTTPYTYAAAGLPAGLSIDPNAGTITGIPVAAGIFPVTLTVTDSTNPVAQTAQATLQLTIGTLSITSALNATGSVNVIFNYQVTATGGSNSYTYAASGLPPGLSIDPSAGAISGSPSSNGTFNVTLTVTDTTDPAATGVATLQIAISALQTYPSDFVTGIVGAPFSYQTFASGGSTPYTYSAQGLPAGLSLDPNTGIISGAPTQTGASTVTLTITDSSTPANSAEELLTIVINAFGIPNSLLANGTVGTAFSYQPPTYGGTLPFTYSSDPLPNGLTLNPVTGAITGTPTVSGFSVIAITVSDSSVPANTSTGYLDLTISAAAAPTAATVTLTLASLDQIYTGSPWAVTATTVPLGLSLSFTYTGSGGTVYGPTATAPTGVGVYAVSAVVTTPNYSGSANGTLSISPAVPRISWATPAAIASGTALSGTQLNASANVAGNLVYSPVLGTVLTPGAQTLSVVFTPTDTTDYTSANAQVSLTVNSPVPVPVITSNPAVTGTAGSALTLYQLTGADAPTSYQITSGTLPAGLSLNTTTGAITGTPTGASTTTVWIAATNVTGQGPSLAIVFTIAPSPTTPVITSNGTASGQVGQAFGYTITATNTPISFAATGLPAGLVLDAATGAITGTPTAPTAAPVAVTLTASTAAATSNPKTLLLSIAAAPAAPAIVSAGLASGQVGQAFTYAIVASNAPTSYLASNLPPGLTVDSTTGAITGTPTLAGVTTASVQAANAGGPGAAANLVVTVAPAAAAPAITSAGSVAGQVGVAFSYQILAAPGTITAYAETGTLPSGLALNPTSGLITGTPADPGQVTVEVTATSAQGTSFPEPLVITIGPADNVPIVTSGHAAVGTVGSAFAFTVTATNLPIAPFPAADTLEVVDLPPGLAVNPATGAITGTPVQSGAFTASVVGTNLAGTGPISSLVITIQPAAAAPVITSSPLAPAQVGTAFSYQITATNAATSFQALGGPAWLSVNGATGLLSGTPTSPGSASLQLVATNASGDSAPASLTISAAPAANTPVVTSAQTVGGQVGSTLSYQIAATSAPLSYLATGLPAGLTLNSLTGLISGTPTDSGSFPVAVSAVNANGQGASVTVTFTVQPSVGLGI
jgi:YVTN family beta-propeller protein